MDNNISSESLRGEAVAIHKPPSLESLRGEAVAIHKQKNDVYLITTQSQAGTTRTNP